MAQLSVDELIEKIAAAYDSLPRQLKRIASYIEQHRGRVMMDRVGDIAEACNVHPSAVVRFAKHFGFSGFSELQAIFRRAYTEQVAPVQSYQQRVRKLIKSNRGRLQGSEIAREFIDGSRQGLDALGGSFDADAFDEALELLVKAKTIYIAGVRRSFAPASYLAYALQHTRKRVILAPGLGGMYREQISSIRRGDALVAISFLPYGKETQYCARMARHNKRWRPCDYRQSVVAAGAFCERPPRRQGRQCLWFPFSNEHDVPVSGALHLFGLQTRT